MLVEGQKRKNRNFPSDSNEEGAVFTASIEFAITALWTVQ